MLKLEGLRVFGVCGPRCTGKTEFARALKAWHAKRFVHAEITDGAVGDHDGAAIIDSIGTIVEAERLRSVYGRNFTLVYVGCQDYNRVGRLYPQECGAIMTSAYTGPRPAVCDRSIDNDRCLTLLGHKAGNIAVEAWANARQ